jgi:hypothetical protein
MADLVPIPLDLFDRLRRIGLDVDSILRRANLPRSRFSVPRPQGSTAKFFAPWRAVEAESEDASLGLRIGVEVPPDDANVASLAAMHSPTLGEGPQKLALYKHLPVTWPCKRVRRLASSSNRAAADCLPQMRAAGRVGDDSILHEGARGRPLQGR